MKGSVLVAGKGFCVGAADIVPGVSGGTMALILGIYPRLVAAIRAFDLEFLRLAGQGRFAAAARHVDAPFLLWLGLGGGAALAFFTQVVRLPELLVSHALPVYSVFFGLIGMSLYLLLRSVENFRLRDTIWVLGGALAGLALILAVPVESPESAWFLLLCGAVAACAMLLPGVSGAFVLLILNQYGYVLGALGRLDLWVLAPFALGALLGLAFASRALAWCLHRFRRRTMLLMSGVVLGSLHALWPFRESGRMPPEAHQHIVRPAPVWPENFDGEVLTCIVLAVLAAFAVLALDRLARTTAEP